MITTFLEVVLAAFVGALLGHWVIGPLIDYLNRRRK